MVESSSPYGLWSWGIKGANVHLITGKESEAKHVNVVLGFQSHGKWSLFYCWHLFYFYKLRGETAFLVWEQNFSRLPLFIFYSQRKLKQLQVQPRARKVENGSLNHEENTSFLFPCSQRFSPSSCIKEDKGTTTWSTECELPCRVRFGCNKKPNSAADRSFQ